MFYGVDDTLSLSISVPPHDPFNNLWPTTTGVMGQPSSTTSSSGTVSRTVTSSTELYFRLAWSINVPDHVLSLSSRDSLVSRNSLTCPTYGYFHQDPHLWPVTSSVNTISSVYELYGRDGIPRRLSSLVLGPSFSGRRTSQKGHGSYLYRIVPRSFFSFL